MGTDRKKAAKIIVVLPHLSPKKNEELTNFFSTEVANQLREPRFREEEYDLTITPIDDGIQE